LGAEINIIGVKIIAQRIRLTVSDRGPSRKPSRAMIGNSIRKKGA
jgi:hypothetical protein